MSAIASRSAGSCSPADAEKPCSLNHLTIVIPRCSASSVTVLTWLVSSWLPVLTRPNPAPRLTGMILPGCCRTSAHYPMSYDPIVLLHAQALLRGTPEGATDYLQADLRDPGVILDRAAALLDFGRPVAVMLLGVLHLIQDAEDPWGIVAALMTAMPPGSYLTISPPAIDIHQSQAHAQRVYNERVATPQTLRTREQVARFFVGLEPVDPGLVQVHQWRPDPADSAPEGTVSAHGGVARKPGT